MVKYIVKRIIMLPITLFLVSILIFFLVNASNIDPAIAILGTNATQEQVEEIHEELGYNNPLVVRYWDYLKNAVRGDFGESYYSGDPVTQEIAARIKPTILVSIMGMIGAIIIGIPLGVLSAVKQYSAADNVISVITMSLQAVPAFFLALLLMQLFCTKLHWLPTYGLSTPKHYILPTICGLIPFLSGFVRNTRSSMLDTIRQDYIITARSKGCTETTVVWTHSFRNALLPIVTMVGQMFAGLLGGTMIVENVFSVPGMGQYVIDAISRKDVPATVAAILLIALFYNIIMLIVDLLYVVVDPRIKASYSSSAKKHTKKDASERKVG